MPLSDGRAGGGRRQEWAPWCSPTSGPCPWTRSWSRRTEAAFVAGGFKGRVVFAEDGLEVPV